MAAPSTRPESFTQSLLWQSVDRGVLGLLGFVINVWVARTIGVEAAGQLASAYALVTILGVLTTLGLEASLPRVLISSKIPETEVLATALMIRRVAGGIVWIFTVSAVVATVGIDSPYLPLVALLGAAWLFPGGELVELFWIAKGKSRNYLNRKLAAIGTARLAKLAAAHSGFVVAVAATQMLESLLHEFAQLSGIRRRLSADRFSASRKAARELLRNNLPLIFAALAVVGYQRLDQIMILQFLGPVPAGHYAAAVQIYELSFAVVLILTKAATRNITAAAAHDDGVSELLKHLRVAAALGWISFPIFWFGSEVIVRTLFGEPYLEAAAPLRWLGLAIGAVAFGAISGVWLVARGLEHLTLQRTLLGLAVNFLLNLALIPSHGPSGAAIATLIAQFTATWGFDALHHSTRAVFWLKVRAALTPFALRAT